MTSKLSLKRICKDTARVLRLVRSRWEIHSCVTLEAAILYYFGESMSEKHIHLTDMLMFALLGAWASIPCSTLNDIYDIKADTINHPERPLPSGKVSVSEAWTLVILTELVFFLTALTCSNGAASYIFLLTHCFLVVSYSYEKTDFKSHWLMGPVWVSGGNFLGKMLVFSWTSLYQSENLHSLAWIIPVTVCSHHLLLVPLKDISDIEGDLKAGREVLVSKIPINAVKTIGVLGYTVPWIAFIYLLSGFEGDHSLKSKLFKLQILAALMIILGMYFTYLIFIRTDLFKWSKFQWLIELAIGYIFLLSLSLCW